ncbi:GRAM domain-containing protein 4-like isoform X4 [Ornithodoros turicata]|uniref:GRAM domain-containing protein 4-like isoform X4 n=1 Tax=Ornithodoros turicata TaxID=34597 RepID=UPI0031386669
MPWRVTSIICKCHCAIASTNLSLQVPLMSLRNLSCPDLTKAEDDTQQLSPKHKTLERAPSLGDSIANCSDTISLYSDLGTDDQDDFLKNCDNLKRSRYFDDSEDSSDCSQMDIMASGYRNDDDSISLQNSQRSSDSLQSSPKMSPKYFPELRKRKKSPAPLSPLTVQQNVQIPSITITSGTPTQEHKDVKVADVLAAGCAALKKWLQELQEDFSECTVIDVPENPPSDDLGVFSLKYTKDTLMRFACVDSSAKIVQHEMYKLIQWKSPLQTLLVIMALLHSLWNEYLITLIFLGVVFGLLRSFINMRGFLGPVESGFTTDYKKLGADKVSAIMSLNLKIALNLLSSQKTFHMLSDIFDKGISLWTWRRPVTTAKILLAAVVLLVYSLLRPPAEVVKIIGTAVTVKVFLLDYVFVRFPRVRAKYDLVWILWNELPTGPEIEKEKRLIRKREKISRKKSDNSVSQAPTITINNNVIVDSRAPSPVSDKECGNDTNDKINSIFEIPNSEKIVQGWEQGKKCTLINKERAFTSAFRNGRLYLTQGHLLFLRYKTRHPKNLVLPLREIAHLECGKPYSWLHGDTMSLIVKMRNNAVYTFGAISSRDDTFASLVEQGLQAGYSWAKNAEGSFSS